MLNYQRLILINKITKDPGLFPRTRNQPGTIKELCSDAPRSNPQAPIQLLTYIYIHYRRKFRSQTSDNIDRWKSRGGKSQRVRRRAEERRSEKRKSEKKENAGAWKGRKAAKHYVLPMICGSGGSKSRLANGCGAIWPDERWKVARRCGAKHTWKWES